MKAKLHSFILFLLSLTYLLQAQTNNLSIIPIPANIQYQKEYFQIMPGMAIGYNHKQCLGLAEILASKLNTAGNLKIETTFSEKGSINLIINETFIDSLIEEGYTLEVNSTNIKIKANSPAGIFYGVQTLLQLLPPEVESNKVIAASWNVPLVKITDFPRFGWRGLMLDVSRHFFTKEEVKTFIDQMVRYKFNTFHWHLSDDNGWRIEIKSYPKLTEVGAWRVERAGEFNTNEAPKFGEKATHGGFYTQEDIKEIVTYAQERFVTIVPEIDVPGHSLAAIASYPELSCTKDTSLKVDPGTSFSEWYGNGTFKMNIDNTLNPSDEKVYEFLDKVLGEISLLFPGQYIHLGGDECYKGYWKNDSSCRNLMKQLNTKHVEDLQSYFVNRVEKIVQSKGKKMLGWDEIYEAGVSKNALIMNWRSISIGADAAKEGYKVVLSPNAYCYLDYYQGDPTIEPPVYAGLRLKQSYSLEPLSEGIPEESVLGGQGNMWTENLPNLRSVQYMLYPRVWAVAETFWSKKENKNWDNFIARVENQFARLEIEDIKYSKAIYDPIVNISFKDQKRWIEMESESPNISIYYTIDGTMPDSHSLLYTQPFFLPEGQITLRIISYRNNLPIGHLIILKSNDIEKRMKK